MAALLLTNNSYTCLLNEPQVLDLMKTHKVTSGIFHWISLKNFNTLIEKLNTLKILNKIKLGV